jgi:hypothetical protein
MLAFERLVEAVKYANEEGTLWWEQFGTKSEAKAVLNNAQHDNPDEYQVIELADGVGEHYLYNDWDTRGTFVQCVRILKTQLRRKS